jgi:hydrogenase expression/formation protein HypE
MKHDKILLAHGSGGKLSRQLIEELILAHLGNPTLSRLDDAAQLKINSGRIAFTTDSFVIDPIFFPGGDIGKLAVCGTVNDLAMSGGLPKYLSLAFILEEGLPLADLERIILSIKHTTAEAGVQVVTGDIKVVGRGYAHKIFINTAGIGLIPDGVNISGEQLAAGDKLIINGGIGEHALAVMTQRVGIEFKPPLLSDVAPLSGLVADMLRVCPQIHALRDPTRGGLAATLNELAQASQVGIVLQEACVPVSEAVAGACELLGFDPLYLANEGKLLASVPAADADKLLKQMRQHKYGAQALVIGEVIAEPKGLVQLKTVIGGTRILDMPSGEPTPRIC